MTSVVSSCLCVESLGARHGWQLKDWAWHTGLLLLQQEFFGPFCVSPDSEGCDHVANAVLSHGRAHAVLSVEKELERKDLGICWIRENFALGKISFWIT